MTPSCSPCDLCLLECYAIGLIGGGGSKILTMISAAGSRTMSCRTSSTWDYSTSTWRWVSGLWLAGGDVYSEHNLTQTDRRSFCYLNFNVHLVSCPTQWFSLVSSRYLWPLARWHLSSLCSTTSWRSESTPGSSPPNSDGRWQPRPETSERGKKSLTQWLFCRWLPM